MNTSNNENSNSRDFTDDPEPIKKLKTESTPSGIPAVQKENNNNDGDAENANDAIIEEKKEEVSQPETQATNGNQNGERRGRKMKSTSSNANEDLKNEYTSDPTAYVDTYEFLKYKDYTYKLNDNLAILNEADSNNDFVCKLTRIIRPKDLETSKVLAFLEVQWYYKKIDLPAKKFEGFIAHFSENEVFLTNQKDFIMVDCINSLATVLSYEEYDSLSKIFPNTYYCRANYDVTKKKMVPPVEKWTKHCICKTPLNPDFMYVQCDKCNGWYHTECLKLSPDEAQALDTYVCKDCEVK